MRNAIAALVNGAYDIVPLSKYRLAQAFLDYGSVELYDDNGKKHVGRISSVQHEDGSGQSFNVCIEGVTPQPQRFHVRTID